MVKIICKDGKEIDVEFDRNGLIDKCVVYNNFDKRMATKTVEAYAKFIALKKIHCDWDATLLSPGPAIDFIWHMHLKDENDYKRMCGDNFIAHRAEGALDAEDTKLKRFMFMLESYEIEFGSPPTIDLSVLKKQNDPKHDPKEYVVLLSMTGEKTKISIGVEDRVELLIKRYAGVSGYPDDAIKLIFKGKQLCVDERLYMHNITYGSVVHVVLKLGGC